MFFKTIAIAVLMVVCTTSDAAQKQVIGDARIDRPLFTIPFEKYRVALFSQKIDLLGFRSNKKKMFIINELASHVKRRNLTIWGCNETPAELK